MIFRILMTVIFLEILLNANDFKDTVKKSNLLSIGFVNYNNNQYLVSIGTFIIKGNSLQSKINAIKSAKILAQSQLVKFIHNININSYEKLEDKTYIIKDVKNIKRKYINIIKEKGGGILKDIIDVGKWTIGNEYFYALAIKINKRE